MHELIVTQLVALATRSDTCSNNVLSQYTLHVMLFCLFVQIHGTTSAYESYTCQHDSSSAIEDNYNQDITSNSKFKKTDDAVQLVGNHGNLQQVYMNKHILKHHYLNVNHLIYQKSRLFNTIECI